MEETDIHDSLDADSTATLAAAANQVKAGLRRASAIIPNHDDNIPNVVNYLCKYNNYENVLCLYVLVSLAILIFDYL